MRTARAGMLFALIALSLSAWAGEFNDSCAYGLSEYDVIVETDCSVNWQDLKTGKTYCFSDANAKRDFLKRPKANIEKAAKAYVKLQKQQ